MALLTLVDAERQFFKSAHGLPPRLAGVRETPLAHCLCRHEVETGEPLVIEDARTHPATRDDDALRALGLGAYAGVPLRSEDGHVLGALCVADVAPRAWRESELHALAQLAETARSEIVLRRSEERFRALTASSPVGVFQSDRGGNITYANARVLELWDAPHGEVLGRGWLARVHRDDLDAVRAGWGAMLATGCEHVQTCRIRLPDGTVRPVDVWAAPLRDGTGAVVGAVGTMADATERRRIERALAESEERLRLALGAAHMIAWEIDLRARDTLGGGRSPAMALTGPSPVALDSYAAFLDAVHPDDRARVAAASERSLAERRDFAEEFRVVLPGGEVRWRYGRGRLLFDASGAPERMVGVNLDVTDRKAMEAELTRRAFHDELTGLANRALFRERVERALARAADEGAPGGEGRAPAVLFLDLDDFKTANDSLGHDAGDRLLTLVADRLLNATRGCDTVARLGGDEFAILLGAVRSEGEAVVVAERVVASLRAPFALDDREVRVGASIGIAVAWGVAGVDDLLRNADVAMYRAKGKGKGRHATFAPEMHAALVDRLDLETELRHALPRGELVLHYQPVVALDSARFVGAEALVRWRHPRRGLVPPNAFIPLAEATGAIVPLGRWVLAEACREAARWNRGQDAPAVSVNVSGRQLEDPEFPAHVAEALRDAALDPRRLILEITEGTLMRDTDATLQRLRAVKRLGVRLAVDDFGTGFSSLAYLQHFPVDVLKIDKAFVEGIAGGGRNTALARTIVALGTALGMTTVAEGIEDGAQQALLRELGCRFGQGYLFARPMTGEALRLALGGG